MMSTHLVGDQECARLDLEVQGPSGSRIEGLEGRLDGHAHDLPRMRRRHTTKAQHLAKGTHTGAWA